MINKSFLNHGFPEANDIVQLANFKVKSVGISDTPLVIIKENLPIVKRASEEGLQKIGEPTRFTNEESEESDEDEEIQQRFVKP